MRTKYADCTRPLVRLPMEGERECVLMEWWVVAVNGAWFNVPAGTQTDGASVPRLLWRVCGHPLTPPRVYAALLHDWLYGGVSGVTRKRADRCYRDMLLHFAAVEAAEMQGVRLAVFRAASWCEAEIEYLALRLCGWTHWLRK